MIIICDVPKGTKARDFDPFPGSEKAINYGCCCPDNQNLWPKQLQFSDTCRVHELEKVRPQ
jgi:hypothetical protein